MKSKVVCIRTSSGRTVCGTPAALRRSNPMEPDEENPIALRRRAVPRENALSLAEDVETRHFRLPKGFASLFRSVADLPGTVIALRVASRLCLCTQQV
jgi:hypothetical protein